jgi:hypothetical protein
MIVDAPARDLNDDPVGPHPATIGSVSGPIKSGLSRHRWRGAGLKTPGLTA